MENIATQNPPPGRLLTRLWLRLRNVFVYGFDRLLDGAEKGKPQQRNDYVGNAEWVIHESQARGARVLLWTSLLAVALLLLWAGFGSIDEVVRGEGVPSRQVQIIQSLDGGIVEKSWSSPARRSRPARSCSRSTPPASPPRWARTTPSTCRCWPSRRA